MPTDVLERGTYHAIDWQGGGAKVSGMINPQTVLTAVQLGKPQLSKQHFSTSTPVLKASTMGQFLPVSSSCFRPIRTLAIGRNRLNR